MTIKHELDKATVHIVNNENYDYNSNVPTFIHIRDYLVGCCPEKVEHVDIHVGPKNDLTIYISTPRIHSVMFENVKPDLSDMDRKLESLAEDIKKHDDQEWIDYERGFAALMDEFGWKD